MEDRADIFGRRTPRRLRAELGSLFLIAAAPTIWAAHFLLCYATAAIWCARIAGRDGSLDGARLLIAAYTAAALAGIAVIARIGWRRHTYEGRATVPHALPTAEDRYRFIGFATLLLATLSFVATMLVAMPALFLETCR